MARRKLDPVQNWWSKITLPEGGGCWTWDASCDQDGYGRFAVGLGGKRQRHTRAHRFAYETFIGPVPAGMAVRHRCDNPPCVRPDHLYVVTASGEKVGECTAGHRLDEQNTYVDGRGHRHCRACGRESSRRYYRRQRE
jgi:hypothetical protein